MTHHASPFTRLLAATVLHAACIAFLPVAVAQTTTDSTSAEESISLNPLDVHATKNVGYGAQNSTSSSRLNLSYVDVPQTVSVMTAEFLNDAKLYDSRYFTEYVNGVFPRSNAHQVEVFYIRGLQISQSYVNGFLATRAANRDSAPYDRVEYVKGPASAAIGRGEAGGLINYIEKESVLTDRGSTSVAFGSDNFYRYDLDVNRVIKRDAGMALRVVTYFESSDDPRGDSLTHTNKVGLAPSFRWDISPNTKLTINADFFKHDLPGNVATVAWSDPYAFQGTLIAGLTGNSAWRPTATTPFLSKDRMIAFQGGLRNSDVAELTAVLTHRFTENLSYRQGLRMDQIKEVEHRWDTPYVVNPDPANPSQWLLPLTFLQNYYRAAGARLQGDLLYHLDAFGRHDFLVGYEGFGTKLSTRTYTSSGFYQNMYTPNYDFPAGFDITKAPQTVSQYNSVTGFSYYGQYRGSYFGDRISTIIGWRSDTTQSVTANRLTRVNIYPGRITTTVPRYSLSYKPIEWFSVYAVHTEQKDPPSTTNAYSNFLATGGGTIPDATDPRRTTLLTGQVHAKMDEAGIKTSFLNGRFTASASAYKIQRDGAIQNLVIVGPGANGLGSLQYNQNYLTTGERLRGWELEAFGTISDRLTFYLGYSKTTGDTGYPNNVRGPIELLIPTATAHLKYDFRGSDKNGFVLTAGGREWFKGWNLERIVTPTRYGANQYVIDAGASYYFGRGRWEANLRVNNLTDQLVVLSRNSAYELRRSYFSLSNRF